MFDTLFGPEGRRRRLLRGNPSGPMRRYLEQPLPPMRARCADIDIVALDFETTGFDPNADHILSIGLVQVSSLAIRLGSARHQMVRSKRPIPEASVVIHGITDDAAAEGAPLEQLLPELLDTLAGNAVLVHHATIERSFLDVACRRLYSTPFNARFIDTEYVARRSMQRRHQPIGRGNLRLFNLREHYHLPRYPAHNALSDAFATAELFLAMAAEKSPNGSATVADFCR